MNFGVVNIKGRGGSVPSVSQEDAERFMAATNTSPDGSWIGPTNGTHRTRKEAGKQAGAYARALTYYGLMPDGYRAATRTAAQGGGWRWGIRIVQDKRKS